jgi:L-phenylalanine/L-methionine N-acetyltransferase
LPQYSIRFWHDGARIKPFPATAKRVSMKRPLTHGAPSVDKPIRNPHISIRAAEPDDAAAISAQLGEDGVFEGTLQMPYAAVASRIERFSQTPPNAVRLVAVERDPASGAERIVGCAGLYPNSPSARQAHVRMLGVSVGKAWQGQGAGGLLLSALLDWADNWAGVLRVELTVYADNQRAIALYQRHGFVAEGTLRANALRAGKYVDSLMMARLHPEQPLLQAP